MVAPVTRHSVPVETTRSRAVAVNVPAGRVGRPGRRARDRHEHADGERRDRGDDELRSLHREPSFLRLRHDRRGGRYRVAIDRLPSRTVLEFRVLGPLEVVGEDGPVTLGGTRQRATLAILLLNANRVVPVERLADELYAGRPPVSAVTQVQRQVSELRRALGSADVIETRPPGYVLRLRDEAFDLARFERLTADAEQAGARDDPGRAAALLRDALELWRGPPLADLAYESFAAASCERLEEMRLAALGTDRCRARCSGGTRRSTESSKPSLPSIR